MKNGMRIFAAVLIVMLLTVPAFAEENARPGITAYKANGIVIDGSLAEWNLDSPAVIDDITQTILDDIFTMIMLVDLKAAKSDMKILSEKLDKVGEEIGVSIRIQHTDLFYAMHRI